MKQTFITMMLVTGLLAAGCAHEEGVKGSTEKVATLDHPGAKVYQSACMSCHVAEGQPTVAPPIFAVRDHVIKARPEREAFVQQVVSWVKAPNAEQALMPGAVSKFGLMPAQPELSDADLQAVAEFMFDFDMAKPDWYAEHYQAEHGKKP